MQVDHETQLIESSLKRGEDFVPSANENIDSYTITQTNLSAIENLLSCPSSNLVAVYLRGSQQISLIDMKNPARRDRFPLKSCDKRFSKQSFILKGIDYSPDGQRLAVGQSDCIIYIYKLSSQQQAQPLSSTIGVSQANAVGPDPPTNALGIKPTITGKFVCSSPITCLVWAETGIVFGAQDGKVKLISLNVKQTQEAQLTANPVLTSASSSLNQSANSPKVLTLFSSPKGAMPISIVCKSSLVAVGFADNTMILILLSSDVLHTTEIVANSGGNPNSLVGGEVTTSNFARRPPNQPVTCSSIEHSCPPYHLTIATNNIICCAGLDGRLAIHSVHFDSSPTQANRSNPSRSLNVSLVESIEFKENIVAINYSNTNETLVVATTSRLLFVKYEQETFSWQLQSSYIELANMLALTSAIWSRDGLQLIVGTLMGSVELFRCSWSKQSIGEQLDICHIAKNRIRITDRARNLLATYKTQSEIKKVHLLDSGQSVIIWTANSLLLARQQSQQLQSEIKWFAREKNVKFCFDHPGFVLLYNQSNRELSLVRLGTNSISFSMKFDSPARRNLIAVRRYPPASSRQSAWDCEDKLSPNLQRAVSSSRNPSISGGNGLIEPTFKPRLQIDTLQEQEIDTGSLSLNVGCISERLVFVSESNCLNVVHLNANNLRQILRRHEKPIVWLKLGQTGDNLAFKDDSKRVYLMRLARQQLELESEPTKRTLESDNCCRLILDRCEFIDWLPESDILVAQSASKISIWYNTEELDKVVKLDVRSYNISNTLPLIDLSLTGDTDSVGKRKGAYSTKAYPLVSKIKGHHLILTNGNKIVLDKVKVRFYTEVVAGRLDSALDVLEQERASGRTLSDLLDKLGWLAINQNDCRIAQRAFQLLEQTKMVKFLELCLESPEECEWRLAMLKGDWNAFEQVAGAEQIVSTYKRLNKWSRLIEYLTRSQQFRQRDLAEQEFMRWLISRGRFLEGAQVQAKSGDLVGALKLLLANKCFENAVEFFIRELKSPLSSQAKISTTAIKPNQDEMSSLIELAKELKLELIAMLKFRLAAVVCEKILDEQKEALELYLKGFEFEAAIRLADRIAPDKLVAVHEQAGEYALGRYRAAVQGQTRKRTLAAIDHYLAAGKTIRALDAAVELMDFERGYEILKCSLSAMEGADKESVERCANSIADHLIEKGDPNRAIETLLMGDQNERAIKVCIEVGKFQDAFEVSLKHKHANNRLETMKEFKKMADKMREGLENDSESGELKTNQIEQIYLLIDEPEAAIELLKGRGNYERMLELIEQYRPDALESTLLLLARQLELDGKLELAERYLLRANDTEWTNVVRMYRLANDWQQAYRVARANCSSERDPLLVQLAYWWSKSLAATEEAYKLLRKLNVFNQVVEFCCENRNFAFAIELCDCDESTQKLKSSLIKRSASYLEQQHKFDKAEELLIKYGKFEEAIKMYLDNDQYSEAIRVAESVEVNGQEDAGEKRQQNGTNLGGNLLNDTLIECANRLAEQVSIEKSAQLNGFGAVDKSNPSFANLVDAHSASDANKVLLAQQLYLRAQRPELAVTMYKQRYMWQEALQVAQRFAPHLLESVELALDEQVSSELAPIVESVVTSRRQQQNSVSRSSSRSSLMSLQSSADGQLAEGQPGNVRKSALGEQAGRQSAQDYLKKQAELSMRSGDLVGTKVALARFIDSLAEGSFGEEAALAHLSEMLHHLEKNQADDMEIWDKIIELADRIVQSSAWGRQALDRVGVGADSAGGLNCWIRLRDILLSCLELIDAKLARNSSAKGELAVVATEIERRLLAAHFISLLDCLMKYSGGSMEDLQRPQHPRGTNEDKRHLFALTPTQAERLLAGQRSSKIRFELLSQVLELIAKLSLSLLRYTDFLEAKGAFYNAGFWQLAVGRPEVARFIWTRLIELADTSSSRINHLAEWDLRRLGVPPSDELKVSPANTEAELQRLAQVRSWLLESLIEGGGAGSIGTGRLQIPLDERGLFESSLESASGGDHNDQEQQNVSRKTSADALAACLVCGYPVRCGSKLIGAGRSWQVRPDEWRKLALVAAQFDQWSSSSSSSLRPRQKSRKLGAAGSVANEGVRLVDIIDFIARLCGADLASNTG